MHNAYMIRNDGKEFPVTVHIYGNPDVADVEETLAASEWLYNATNHSNVKSSIEKLLAAYAHSLDPDLEVDEIADTLIYQFKHVGYKVVSEEFVESLSSKFESIDLKSLPSLENLNTLVNQELNQEFLRARFGGMYDSDNPAGKVMYFRISSVGFNWFDIIWAFVEAHKREISYVTVVKDPEATGLDGYYYKLGQDPVNNMLTNEFLTASGRPVFDKKTVLSNGGSLETSMKNMNSDRRSDRIRRYHIIDARENCEKFNRFYHSCNSRCKQ